MTLTRSNEWRICRWYQVNFFLDPVQTAVLFFRRSSNLPAATPTVVPVCRCKLLPFPTRHVLPFCWSVRPPFYQRESSFIWTTKLDSVENGKQPVVEWVSPTREDLRLRSRPIEVQRRKLLPSCFFSSVPISFCCPCCQHVIFKKMFRPSRLRAQRLDSSLNLNIISVVACPMSGFKYYYGGQRWDSMSPRCIRCSRRQASSFQQR